MAEYIDLNNTEVLAEAGDNAKLVVEEDGELKRIPASAVGQVKTVNGVEPDEAGNVDVSGLPEGVPVIQSATVGQTVVVKAVDESGKPTEWEAVDAAEISNYLVITGKAPAASATDIDYSTFEYSANLSFDYAAKLIRAGQLAGVAVNFIATYEDPESGAYLVQARPIGVATYMLEGNADASRIVIVTGDGIMADMYDHPYPFTEPQGLLFTKDGVQLDVQS